MDKSSRTEQEVFADLEALCCKPGFIHAIAQLSFRDNVIMYRDDMDEADMAKMSSPTRLIRTEINTLLGLTVKSEIDWTLPDPATMQEYSSKAESLLEELHHSLSAEFWSGITKEDLENNSFNPFESGEVLREPIFYSSESAYTFQYIALADRKYSPDTVWLSDNMGFTIDQVTSVARAIDQLFTNQLEVLGERMRQQSPDEWSMLAFFTFSLDTIAEIANLDIEVVEQLLNAFTFPSEVNRPGYSGDSVV